MRIFTAPKTPPAPRVASSGFPAEQAQQATAQQDELDVFAADPQAMVQASPVTSTRTSTGVQPKPLTATRTATPTRTRTLTETPPLPSTRPRAVPTPTPAVALDPAEAPAPSLGAVPGARSATFTGTSADTSAAPKPAAAVGEATESLLETPPVVPPVVSPAMPLTETGTLRPGPASMLRPAPRPGKQSPVLPPKPPVPMEGDARQEPVLPAAPGRFPRTTRHVERVKVSYDSISDSFTTELVDYDEPSITGWDMSPPQQTPRQVGGLTLTPKRRGVVAEHDDFMERDAEIDPAIQQELRRRAAKTGDGVAEGEYELSFDHDIDAQSTSAVYERPPKEKAALRDALLREFAHQQEQRRIEDLKGNKSRKKRREKLNEFAGELPGMVLVRPPPLKESAPLRR